MKKILSVILSLMLVFAGMAPAAMADNSLSSDATLLDISFDNHSVVNGEFDPTVTTYNVQQPYRFSKDGNGYKDAPVTVIKSDKNATVGEITRVVNESETMQTITIPVTAADGVTTKTYTLKAYRVGKNQYSNPGFENEALGDAWSTSVAGCAMEKSTDYAYSGSSSLKYTPESSVCYPYQAVALPKDSNMTFFSHLAVKSTLTMRAYNRYTSADSHYYVDANGDVITDDEGNALTCGSTSFLNGVLTEADENGWKRSMRISKGLTTLQESSTSGDASSSTASKGIAAYFDEFYVGPLVIGSVNVTSDGEDYVRCGEAATINFEAELLNQYGNKGGLADETVTWHLINAPEGVAIDSATGVVTVPATLSEAGEFYVEARVIPTFNQGITSSWSIHCQDWMGGRAKVSVIPYNASAQLSDIEINGGSVYGFNSAATSYDIYVPYVYEENNFNNFAMPTVSATPVNADGNVEITYPDAVADGEKIYIDVTDASGVLSTRYTLTIKTVGGNLFPDGGFETEAATNYKNLDYGNLTTTIEADESAAGNKLMKTQSDWGDGGNPVEMGYINNITLYPNKTYVSGLWVKTDPNKPEGNTNLTFTPDIKGGRFYNDSDTSLRRKEYTTDVYYSYSGAAAGNTLTLTNNWQKVMTTFSCADTVNVGLALPALKTTTYMLLDELYLGELVIANMDVKDSDNATAKTVTAPATGETETINLTASIKNQYGNTIGLADETYVWSELVDYAGVSVDNGVVTIDNNAAPGKVVIEATVTPSYTGAAQSAVSKRYTLTILPRDGFVTVGNTHTVTFTNKTGVALNLSFISAIYEGTALKSVISTNDISASDGETISRSHDMAVGAGQTIKHFLWNKTTLTPYIAQ